MTVLSGDILAPHNIFNRVLFSLLTQTMVFLFGSVSVYVLVFSSLTDMTLSDLLDLDRSQELLRED